MKFKKLRERIISTYGSQKQFADKLGVAPLTVSRKLRGETGFSLQDIVVWCKMLDISLNNLSVYFLEGEK